MTPAVGYALGSAVLVVDGGLLLVSVPRRWWSVFWMAIISAALVVAAIVGQATS